MECGATEDELLDKGEPCEINTLIPIFSQEEGQIKYSTHLTSDCIRINDDKETTPEYKLLELKKRLNREGIELEVINKL